MIHSDRPHPEREVRSRPGPEKTWWASGLDNLRSGASDRGCECWGPVPEALGTEGPDKCNDGDLILAPGSGL